MADTTIRDYLMPGDLGWVLQQHAVSYAKMKDYNLEFEKDIAKSILYFIEQYQQKNAGIWICESKGAIVGTIAVHPLDSGEAEIRWIYVDPLFQGQGIGSRLMKSALAYCKKKAYKSVHCRNVASDSPGIPLYEQYGFRIRTEEEIMKWGKTWISRHYVLYLEAYNH